MSVSSLSRIFSLYGDFCATRPREVIFITITLIAILTTTDGVSLFESSPESDEESGTLLLVLKVAALLNVYLQGRELQATLFSGMTGVFLCILVLLYSVFAVRLLQCSPYSMKDFVFLPLLTLDVSRMRKLTPITPTAHLVGMAVSSEGAGIALDSLVEAMVVAAASLLGVPMVSRVALFSVLAILTNLITLSTFYPAILCLALQMGAGKRNSCGNCRSPSCLTPSPRKGKLSLEKIAPDSTPVISKLKVGVFVGVVGAYGVAKFSSLSSGEEEGWSFFSLLVPNKEKLVCALAVIAVLIKYSKFEGWKQYLIEEESLRETSEEASSPCSEMKELCTTNSNRDNYQLTVEESRGTEACVSLMNSSEDGVRLLSDSELVSLASKKLIRPYKLETLLGDHERGVRVRRKLVQEKIVTSNKDSNLSNWDFSKLPYAGYDYSKVTGVCCENVIGYVPIPVGVAGPLTINGVSYHIPMATTEGCLVASTNRGCLALQQATSLDFRVFSDGMTRAPVVTFDSMRRADEVREWINTIENQESLKEAFNSTSNFARLSHVTPRVSGNDLHLRFVAITGDAMGMNMVSKGAEAAMSLLKEHHPDMRVLSISGNMCTDKKPSALNWILGRGKSVSCEAVIPSSVIKVVLKTSVKALVQTNTAKNLEGSALAGSIGGFNAHAANIVAAIFIACGQDPAQVVGSSNCMTKMDMCEDGALRVSVTLPSLEVGTVGGGTCLPPQSAALNMLGVKGAHASSPGDNARQLALIIAGAVLAGELSVLAALTAGHLVNSHLKMNRAAKPQESVKSPEGIHEDAKLRTNSEKCTEEISEREES